MAQPIEIIVISVNDFRRLFEQCLRNVLNEMQEPDQKSDDDELLTGTQAKAFLKMKDSTFLKLRKQGKIKMRVIGKSKRYLKSELLKADGK